MTHLLCIYKYGLKGEKISFQPHNLILVDAANHFTEDLCHQGLHNVGCLLHFLVTNLYGVTFNAQIGDNADTECAYATVVSHDDFGHC